MPAGGGSGLAASGERVGREGVHDSIDEHRRLRGVEGTLDDRVHRLPRLGRLGISSALLKGSPDGCPDRTSRHRRLIRVLIEERSSGGDRRFEVPDLDAGVDVTEDRRGGQGAFGGGGLQEVDALLVSIGVDQGFREHRGGLRVTGGDFPGSPHRDEGLVEAAESDQDGGGVQEDRRILRGQLSSLVDRLGRIAPTHRPGAGEGQDSQGGDVFRILLQDLAADRLRLHGSALFVELDGLLEAGEKIGLRHGFEGTRV